MATIGSCESSHCSAYSKDLHWCIYQCLGLDFSYRKVASNLGIDPSTVSCVVKRFQCTGSVTKKKYDSSTLPRKLTDIEQRLVLYYISHALAIESFFFLGMAPVIAGILGGLLVLS